MIVQDQIIDRVFCMRQTGGDRGWVVVGGGGGGTKNL